MILRNSFKLAAPRFGSFASDLLRFPEDSHLSSTSPWKVREQLGKLMILRYNCESIMPLKPVTVCITDLLTTTHSRLMESAFVYFGQDLGWLGQV